MTNYNQGERAIMVDSLSVTLFHHRASLIAYSNSLFLIFRFPVPVCSEMLRNRLSLFVNWSSSATKSGSFGQNSLHFPGTSGNSEWRPVRIGLHPPPRSPAELRFSDAVGKGVYFPRLWRGRVRRLRSPGKVRGLYRPRTPISLWPRQTLSRQIPNAPSETGSTVVRDRFE